MSFKYETVSEIIADRDRLRAERDALAALLLDARDSLCTHTDAYDIALIARIDAALKDKP